MADDQQDVEKKIIEVPKLPNIVQGDGRQLMHLLKDFLKSMSEQVNLANGFSAEEIKPGSSTSIPTPKNFFLTFNRFGGLLSWDHILDLSKLAYYEVRENTNVGSDIGLLERTVENESDKLPVNYVAHVYLYSVSQGGEYSDVTEIRYTKPRPDAPSDIAMTKNNEGTLITFLDIPINCIGANIYVNGSKYQSLGNIYLYKHGENEKIRLVEVAYYDQFGEGERASIYAILPDVAGFLVERNGANLDFYWDALNIYGVQYVVKVGGVPEWDKALELFRTKLNKHRYVYPNTGDYYLMIKAVDEHNNYSDNAAWFLMNSVADISKNIILEYPQSTVGYSGNKINLYFDVAADGLRLERDAMIGEYIIDVQLPQTYSARNWLEYACIGVTNNNLTWDDVTFSWDSEEAAKTAWAGVIGDLDGVTVKQQIAIYRGKDVYGIDAIKLNGNLRTENGSTPVDAFRADVFMAGRWAQGLLIGDLTKLAYGLSAMQPRFSVVFYLKKTVKLPDTIFMTLADNSTASFLCVGYDQRTDEFYLRGSDSVEIRTKCACKERDWLTVGISQGADKRALYVYSLASDGHAMAEVSTTPIGKLPDLYCYPKIII